MTSACKHNLAEMNAAAQADQMCPACREQLLVNTTSTLRRFLVWFNHNEHSEYWDDWIDQFYRLQEIADQAKEDIAKAKVAKAVVS